jgi:hypothetical protein
MKPTYAELEKRVAELERVVAELKARPPEQHNHWHSHPTPYYQPYQYPLGGQVLGWPQTIYAGVSTVAATGGGSCLPQ